VYNSTMASTELRPDSIFENFYIHCKRDAACLDSIEMIGEHCRNQNHNLAELDMVCGECGETFTNLRKLTRHAAKPGFKFRTSNIRNYNKDLFDPNTHFELISTAETHQLPTVSPIFPEITSKYFRNPQTLSASLHPSTSTPLHQLFTQEHDVDSTDTDLPLSQQQHSTGSSHEPPTFLPQSLEDIHTISATPLTDEQPVRDTPTFMNTGITAPPPTPADLSLNEETLQHLAQQQETSWTETFRSPTPPQSPPIIVTTQVSEPSGTSRPLGNTSTTFTFRAPNVSIPLHAPAPSYDNYFHQFAFQNFFNPPPRFQSTLRTPANFMLPSHVTPETTLTYPYLVALVRHLEWTIRLLSMAFVTNPVPLSVITLD